MIKSIALIQKSIIIIITHNECFYWFLLNFEKNNCFLSIVIKGYRLLTDYPGLLELFYFCVCVCGEGGFMPFLSYGLHATGSEIDFFKRNRLQQDFHLSSWLLLPCVHNFFCQAMERVNGNVLSWNERGFKANVKWLLCPWAI